MKVALISHSFPPNMTGGIGSYTFSLAEALSNKGIEVTVFCGGRVKKELKCNFKIKRLPMLNFPPRAVWFQIQNNNYFKNELKKFDIIHGQNTTSTFYTIIKNKVDKPWIVTIHDCPQRGLKSFIDSPYYTKNIGDFIFNVAEYPLYKILYSKDLKNADKIISVSNSLLTDLKKYFKFDINKSIVINNGVDVCRIKKIIKGVRKRENEKIRIIFVGRLFYGKGLTFLIEAVKKIVNINKNFVLNIYGEGPLENVIKKQIIKHNLTEYIRINHFMSNEKIIKEIYKSDILVLPSLYESFSITVLESMACSTPVIATNIGGMKELIKDKKTGILVPSKDPHNLSKAIICLLNNINLAKKIGDCGRKEILLNYSWDNIANQYIKLYNEVLKDHATLKT